MFCPKCGAEAADDSIFCGTCGASFEGRRETSSLQLEEIPEKDHLESIASVGNSISEEAETKPNKNKKIAAIVAGIVAVIAIITICIFVFAGGEKVKVTANFSDLGYDDDSSPVAIQVEGTDENGNVFEQEFFVCPGSMDLDGIPYGIYTFSLPASPVLEDGTMFTTEGVFTEVEINENRSNVELAFDLSKLDPETITDEQIQSSKDMIVRAGGTTDEAQAFCDAAASKRDSAIQEREAAEAKAAEEAAAAAQAARHVEAASFSFDMPEYWVDKANVEIDGNNVTITSTEYGRPLLWASLSDEYGIQQAGDPSGGLLFYAEAGTGKYVKFNAPSYESLAQQFSEREIQAMLGISKAECEALANIHCNGCYTTQVRQSWDLMESEIRPTIIIK